MKFYVVKLILIFLFNCIMTTILQLPEEILKLIFKELWPSPPRECRYVCKSWYLPAHTMCLENIYIRFSQIPRFIASIDCNPDPAYISAIKSVFLSPNDTFIYQNERHVIDKEMIDKLICRFPNLKSVSLHAPSSTFDEFNDDICKKILEKCCKLNRFEIHSELHDSRYRYEVDAEQKSQAEYLDAHCKLRLLLTKIDFRDIDFSLRPESSVDYISRFPRLVTIYDVPNLDTFQKLLPALVHLSQLKRIDMRNVLDDREDFAETFILTKTKEERKQLIKLLSSVKN